MNLTSGGSPFMKIDERIQPSVRFSRTRVAEHGSMNFGLFPLLNRHKDFKHAWERQHLENSRDLVFRNTFKDIEFAVIALSRYGSAVKFECHDVSPVQPRISPAR